ncbi:short chain dehydrogenase/reductase family oxidoreductase [Leptolyngbya sp. NIES-3755]|nr:short chain dehydrogenase/reductase family oxidoreductase [Leptolyngbya sp. NIES-3755]
MDISPEQLENCLQVLQQIADDPTLIDHHDRFKSLIAKIHKQGRKQSRQTQHRIHQSEDRATKESCLIVQLVQPMIEGAVSKAKQLNLPISCYICKTPYTQVHFFYHLLCPTCAEFNYQKRFQQTNLTGRTALVTGGRIKIGYQTVLRLLRDRARVIVTTRFPRDCANRYQLEPDFEQWRDRLEIYGLDLRNLSAVEGFIEQLLQTKSSIDILINNAAQTIKRPLAFYQHLLEEQSERVPLLEAQESSSLLNSYFPPQMFDRDGQPLDLRPTNSWLLKLDQVSTIELLEVQLVNAIAPFLLNSKLKPLLQRSPFDRRFIINVSAMEGQFNRINKTPFHPHTNMAKAALNMMTRTAASDYAEDNIFMNSVDTGWITNENPYPKRTNIEQKRGFYPPLDIIDGMARIYDPIVQGINSATPQFGHFLKDYVPHPW